MPVHNNEHPSLRLEDLRVRHPHCFGQDVVATPLKLNIVDDLHLAYGGSYTLAELRRGVYNHTKSNRYLQCLVEGRPRIGLDGQPAGVVSPSECREAQQELLLRRPAELLRQVQASRLGPSQYRRREGIAVERFWAAYEKSLALLKCRCSEQAELVAAFKASGKSMEDFAKSYGISRMRLQRVFEDESALLQASSWGVTDSTEARTSAPHQDPAPKMLRAVE